MTIYYSTVLNLLYIFLNFHFKMKISNSKYLVEILIIHDSSDIISCLMHIYVKNVTIVKIFCLSCYFVIVTFRIYLQNSFQAYILNLSQLYSLCYVLDCRTYAFYSFPQSIVSDKYSNLFIQIYLLDAI